MALRPVQKDVPIEAVREVVRIVRAGTEKSEAAQLFAAGDDIISWGGYSVFGEPGTPPVMGSAPTPAHSDETVLSVMEAIVADHEIEPFEPGTMKALPIPATVIVKFVLQLLASLL